MKMLRGVYIGTDNVEIELNRVILAEEANAFNKLVEGTDLAIPEQSGYYFVSTFRR
ncbi:hypothetical protein ACIQYL_25505 [Lysinibacillus xylanilyticus]|uniref:hypothetical protein n=1 Tax=Lysinibacillus xylanilyticus TaxID=582475 RepID=UPI0037F6908C